MSCECSNPGYCPRYGREMDWRYWQYCQGKSGLPREHEQVYLSRLGLPVLDPGKNGTASGVPPPARKRFPDIVYPSGITKEDVFSFGVSLAKFINSGMRTVSPEQFGERMAVCSGCPLLYQDGGEPRCRACRCFLRIKGWWAVMDCPSGLWPKLPDPPPHGGCGCG